MITKFSLLLKILLDLDGKEYLSQAAYSIAEEKTHQKEFALFNTLDQSHRKIIITSDEFDYSTSTVRHISLASPEDTSKKYKIKVSPSLLLFLFSVLK